MGRSKSAILAIRSIYTITELNGTELNYYYYYFSRYSYAGQLYQLVEFVYAEISYHKNWCISELNIKCLKREYILKFVFFYNERFRNNDLKYLYCN